MELLVKIALVVVIIIAVTICVLEILITIPVIVEIYGYENSEQGKLEIFKETDDGSTIITFNDTITNFTSEVYPIPFDYVINMVNNPKIMDFSTYDSLTNNQHTPEMEYCKLSMGQHAYITPPDGTEISVCLYKDDPWETWNMMGSYIPLKDNTPREIQCTNSEGIPITVPDPLGDTLTLCIVYGEEAEAYIFHDWWTRNDKSVQN